MRVLNSGCVAFSMKKTLTATHMHVGEAHTSAPLPLPAAPQEEHPALAWTASPADR